MLGTAAKVRVARIAAATLLRIGFRARRQIRRGGITYDVDLREGIDLSLFLFGTFQRHVMRTVLQFVPADGIVLDVGANIGAMTLPIAAHLTGGHIYAFEPTDFAYAKLERNLELNPALAQRITTIKSFLADRPSTDTKMIAYSSWPLVDSSDSAHPVHKGVPKHGSSEQTSIDVFVNTQDLSKLSLIKVDTDGHEWEVLSGAQETLQRLRPVVLFEACEYLMKPPRATFTEFEKLFERAGYKIRYGDRLEVMSAATFYATCPLGGGLDIVAVPEE